MCLIVWNSLKIRPGALTKISCFRRSFGASISEEVPIVDSREQSSLSA